MSNILIGNRLHELLEPVASAATQDGYAFDRALLSGCLMDCHVSSDEIAADSRRDVRSAS